MRYIGSFCFFMLSMGVFSSCQKVINVDLRDSGKKYVIEGIVGDQKGTCKVMVSQTKDFDDNNSFDGVGGAAVYIADNMTGDTAIMKETSAGVYEDSLFTGMTGHSYSLRVVIDGNAFTAMSTMPPFVPMDSLYITEEQLFGNTRNLANIQYRDPEGEGDHYRFVEFINGRQIKKIFVRDDELTDGNEVTVMLRYMDNDDDNQDDIHPGDTVTVEMQCIDPAVYKYWYSLNNSATGDGQSASPANPVSNMEGGALGYFSAHTLQKRSVIAH